MSLATSGPPLDSFEPPPGPVKRFTVAEYHALIRTGVFVEGDPYELLEGWIAPKMTRNPPHDVAIELLDAALRPLLPRGRRIRIQSAITTGDSEPEPDLAVVHGVPRDYLGHHPGPTEIALLVEVAEASLDRDRHWNARIYARAGIATYWLINLVEDRVEVFTDPTGPDASPRYRQTRILARGDALALEIAGQAIGELAVADLLP
jgi:Uma2 family endonuclease